MNPLVLENVRKIAVLRPGALGDLIVTLPALQALRESYREAHITLLGSPWQETFLREGRTVIDRVVSVPPLPGLRSADDGEHPDEEGFVEAMRNESFDLAISFQGRGLAGNRLINRLGARLTVGTWSPGAEKTHRFVQYYYYQHEVLRFLELARLAGATPQLTEPHVSVLASDMAEIASLEIIAHSLPFVIFNPFATDIRRTWPLAHYEELAAWFHEQGIAIVFTGSVQDEAAVKQLMSRLHFEAVNACGISFGAVAALASRALMMVGPDTGPLHLAQAVGCPTVGIYWAPNMINWSPLFRATHRPVISWALLCPLCGKAPNRPHPFEPISDCRHEVSFVRDISVAEVTLAASEILEHTGQGMLEKKPIMEIQDLLENKQE